MRGYPRPLLRSYPHVHRGLSDALCRVSPLQHGNRSRIRYGSRRSCPFASFYFLLAILRNNSHPVRSTHSEREFESIRRVVQPSTTIWFQDVFVLPLPLTLYSAPLASLNLEHFYCFPFTFMMFSKRLLLWGLSAIPCDSSSNTPLPT